MGTLDYGRGAVDEIIREIGQEFFSDAASLAGRELPREVESLSKQYGLQDTGYIWFILFKHPKSWRRAAGNNAEDLDTALRLFHHSGAKDPMPRDYTLPPGSMERDVDSLLSDLGRWAATTFKKELLQVFVATGKKFTRNLTDAMSEAIGSPATAAHARHAIVTDLPLRVKDHPHWFKDHLTLHQALESLLQ